MNTELLFKLYAIHSESGNEKKMRRFIRKYITENCGNVELVTDPYGNLLCTKGDSKTYPCLASHIDQVQHVHSKDFEVVSNGEVCFGYSHKSREQQGLGADDKNGIFICLECLKTFDVLKVAFFVGEEVGCVGSHAVSLDFFSDCRFIIEPDRRGGSDLITSMFVGKVCSDEFIKAIGAPDYGYSEERGSITDVGTLVDRGVGISCLNLSCGYYCAHTDEEFTVLSELQNCLDFVMHVINDCREVFPFTVSYGGYDIGRNYGYRNYGYGYGSYGYGSYGGRTLESCLTKHQAKQAVVEEEEDEYVDGGYYDMDFQLMQSYLESDKNLTFEVIWNNYGYDFYATMLYETEDARSILEEIYDDVLALEEESPSYSHDEFWNDKEEPVSGAKVS